MFSAQTPILTVRCSESKLGCEAGFLPQTRDSSFSKGNSCSLLSGIIWINTLAPSLEPTRPRSLSERCRWVAGASASSRRLQTATPTTRLFAESATRTTRIRRLGPRRQLHVCRCRLRSRTGTLWCFPLLGVGCPAAVDHVNRVIAKARRQIAGPNDDCKA